MHIFLSSNTVIVLSTLQHDMSVDSAGKHQDTDNDEQLNRQELCQRVTSTHSLITESISLNEQTNDIHSSYRHFNTAFNQGPKNTKFRDFPVSSIFSEFPAAVFACTITTDDQLNSMLTSMLHTFIISFQDYSITLPRP